MPEDTILRRSIEAHKGGRLNEAEVGYRRILRKYPNDPNALNFLGMLRFHQGHKADALKLLQQSVESDPENPHARINLGNVLLVHENLEDARASFLKATELAPEMAATWYNLGVCYRRMHRANDAADCLYKALKMDRGHSQAHEALGMLLYRTGKFHLARDVYQEWLDIEPDNAIARHMLAAMSNDQSLQRADDAFVATLFDRFAATFDQNLAELGYRAPELLGERVTRIVRAAGEEARVDILDAGCGTGLAAPLLRGLARKLVGVDLSPGMVEKAEARKLYDELIVQELSAFMRSRTQAFDVILSTDTLVYFGALEEPLAAARSCVRPGGSLLFSLEKLDCDTDHVDYRLQPHGRYSHGESYVRRVVAESGFTLTALENHTLRRELGKDVIGHVVTATAPG